ncbi:hypothetical protein BGZ96_009284, partial [Linnemannia gamsii]
MAKRLTTQVLAQPPQKSPRTGDGNTDTALESQPMGSDYTPPMTKLATAIFGERPQNVEFHAVGYLRSLKSQPMSTPSTDGYLAYVMIVVHEVP